MTEQSSKIRKNQAERVMNDKSLRTLLTNNNRFEASPKRSPRLRGRQRRQQGSPKNPNPSEFAKMVKDRVLTLDSIEKYTDFKIQEQTHRGAKPTYLNGSKLKVITKSEDLTRNRQKAKNSQEGQSQEPRDSRLSDLPPIPLLPQRSIRRCSSKPTFRENEKIKRILEMRKEMKHTRLSKGSNHPLYGKHRSSTTTTKDNSLVSSLLGQLNTEKKEKKEKCQEKSSKMENKTKKISKGEQDVPKNSKSLPGASGLNSEQREASKLSKGSSKQILFGEDIKHPKNHRGPHREQPAHTYHAQKAIFRANQKGFLLKKKKRKLKKLPTSLMHLTRKGDTEVSPTEKKVLDMVSDAVRRKLQANFMFREFGKLKLEFKAEVLGANSRRFWRFLVNSDGSCPLKIRNFRRDETSENSGSERPIDPKELNSDVYAGNGGPKSLTNSYLFSRRQDSKNGKNPDFSSISPQKYTKTVTGRTEKSESVPIFFTETQKGHKTKKSSIDKNSFDRLLSYRLEALKEIRTDGKDVWRQPNHQMLSLDSRNVKSLMSSLPTLKRGNMTYQSRNQIKDSQVRVYNGRQRMENSPRTYKILKTLEKNEREKNAKNRQKSQFGCGDGEEGSARDHLQPEHLVPRSFKTLKRRKTRKPILKKVEPKDVRKEVNCSLPLGNIKEIISRSFNSQIDLKNIEILMKSQIEASEASLAHKTGFGGSQESSVVKLIKSKSKKSKKKKKKGSKSKKSKSKTVSKISQKKVSGDNGGVSSEAVVFVKRSKRLRSSQKSRKSEFEFEGKFYGGSLDEDKISAYQKTREPRGRVDKAGIIAKASLNRIKLRPKKIEKLSFEVRKRPLWRKKDSAGAREFDAWGPEDKAIPILEESDTGEQDEGNYKIEDSLDFLEYADPK